MGVKYGPSPAQGYPKSLEVAKLRDQNPVILRQKEIWKIISVNTTDKETNKK